MCALGALVCKTDADRTWGLSRSISRACARALAGWLQLYRGALPALRLFDPVVWTGIVVLPRSQSCREDVT